MKAAVYETTGTPDVLHLADVPDPVPGRRTLLVRNEYISIEGGDVLHRAGGELARVPHIVGYQSAGTVVEVGDDVTEFAVGDRVVTLGMDGSHAERRVVPEGFAWHIPDGVTTREASVVPVPFGTAHDALFEFGHLAAGEHVLITAGAGGVGVAAIQLAKRAGATVITTASTAAKRDRLAELGADVVLDSTDDGLVDAVRRASGGRGVDVIVENVGGDVFSRVLHALANRGRCVSVGEVGRGAATTVDVGQLRPLNLTVTGYFMGMEMLTARRCHAVVASVLDAFAAGELHAVIDREFPLAEAADAHAVIESRGVVGRVLLVP